MALPKSAQALAAILDDPNEAETAKKIRARFDRTAVWKWRNGRGLPDLKSATVLQWFTGGRVLAVEWIAAPRKRAA